MSEDKELSKLHDDELFQEREELQRQFEAIDAEISRRLGESNEERRLRENGPGPDGNKPQTESERLNPIIVDAYKNSLPWECRKAFDSLVGCPPWRLVSYLASLRLAYGHHQHLQSDPSRMTRAEVESLVGRPQRPGRTQRLADDWEEVFKLPFGQEVLKLARCSDPSASKDEFRSVPRRLHILAKWAGVVWRKTTHHARPLYDDILAELLVYVETATKEPNLTPLALLVGHAIGNPNYFCDNLAGWKAEHKPALERARLRLHSKP